MASLHVYGIKPPDETWRKMKAVYDACIAAKIDIPEKVSSFFNDEPPDSLGVVFEVPAGRYDAEMTDGLEVVLADLPIGTKIIRFTVSY